MKAIEVKKSNIALLVLSKKTNEQIAAIYGITVKEVLDVKLQFGFTKFRGTKTAKAYTINLVDDCQQIIDTLSSKQEKMDLVA